MSEGELDVLAPPRRELTIRGERLDFQPLVLGQLPEMERLCGPLAVSLCNLQALPDGEVLLEVVAALLQIHGELLPRAVALAVGRPLKWVALCTLEELAALAVAAFALNQDFFRQGVTDLMQAPAKGRRGGQESWELADNIQLLVASGHAISDVLSYTLVQYRAHLAAATRHRRRQLRQMAAAMRAAQLYDKQGFASYVKDLSNG